jgi:peptidoglycan/xylan/chitin deacetylase (PgdA/CDA1 family)
LPEFRLDRLASLYIFHPLEKARPFSNAFIPVLMYHSISSDRDEHSGAYYKTTTSPERFAEHMRFLHENGYSTVNLDGVIDRLRNPSRGESKAVAITFDDGFRDFYSDAFPILEQYGFSATMFLPTSYIGHSAQQFKGRDCLTWDQACELSDAGVVFGSHSATHPQLHLATPAKQRRELQESKDSIEQILGVPVHSFSYPYAFPEQDQAFAQRLREELSGCGYTNGVSTIVGRAASGDDNFFLKRLPINDADDRALFQAKLEGGYDWLHRVQYATKVLRSEIRKWHQPRPTTT